METDEQRSVADSPFGCDLQLIQPRVWPVFIAPIIALAIAMVFQSAIAGWFVARELASGTKPAELSQRLLESFAAPGLFILLAAGGQLAFAVAAFLPARLSPTPTLQRLGLVPFRQSWTIYPLTMFGSLAPLAVGAGAAHLLAEVLPPEPTFQILLDKITLGWGIIFVLFIAFAPGFCEELLFRGYMQRRLLQRWRPWTAVTATSIIFGLMHVMPHAILVALPLGFWFGVIAWRTGSVLPCIACHAFINGGVNAWRMVVKFAQVPENMQTMVVVTALVLGLGCFIVACRQLARADT